MTAKFFQRKKNVCALLAVAVALFAAVRASEGIRWSVNFHPDEVRVARWMAQSWSDGYVKERVYPGGWFVLADMAVPIRRLAFYLNRRVASWTGQDGAVDALFSESFENDPLRLPLVIGSMAAGRVLNVALLSAAVLFLFLAVYECGAGSVGAVVAALLLADSPFALEHVHYCETDPAALFATCLAGWLACRGLRLGSLRWTAAALFAAGFAIASKYTYAPLLLWAPALAAVHAHGRPRGRRLSAFAAALGILVATVVLGFLAGTPAIWRDPSFFFGGLGRITARTWAEADRALGPQRTWAASCLWRLDSLVREAAKLGAPSVALSAAGILLSFRRGDRRWMFVFPLFAAAFVLHAVFSMPWIRNQEVLPLLPPLCLFGGMAAGYGWQALRGGDGRAARLVGAALLALSVVALVRTHANGSRIVSCFARRDTRAECQNWMAACSGPEVRLATSQYVAQALRGTGRDSILRNNVAENWPAFLGERAVTKGGVRYVLRNGSFTGRRVFGADAVARRDAFRRDCTLLAAWRPSAGNVRTVTFAQPDIELWALPENGVGTNRAAAADLPLCLDVPVFFAPGHRSLYEPEHLAPGLGPRRAVRVDRVRHEAHPPSNGKPCWAVARVLDGAPPDRFSWNGLFLPQEVQPGPSGVSVFELDCAAFRRRSARDIFPGARIRTRGGSADALCAAVLSGDPTEAAHALRCAGDPSGALQLLSGLPALDAAAQVEAFLAARAAGVEPDPSWTEAARAAAQAFREVEARGWGVGTAVRGVPLAVLRDFAFLRIESQVLPAIGLLPVWLPPGRYRVSVRLEPGKPEPASKKWFKGQDSPLERGVDSAGEPACVTTVRVDRGDFLRSPLLVLPGEGVERLAFARIEIGWEPVEQLQRASAELQSCLETGK